MYYKNFKTNKMMRKLITYYVLFTLLINISEARRDLNYKYRNECKKNFCLGENTLELLAQADLDHIIPLSKGGSNDKENLMYIPKYLNKVFSDNDYLDLKINLLNLESDDWDNNDEGRFFNPKHPVYKTNEYLFNNRNKMSSKDRKNYLNNLNTKLDYNKKKNNNGENVNPTFLNNIVQFAGNKYVIITMIACGYLDNNGEYLCIDELINKTIELYEEYEPSISNNINDTYHSSSEFIKNMTDTFSEQMNSTMEGTQKYYDEKKPYVDKKINETCEKASEIFNDISDKFSEGINSNIEKAKNIYEDYQPSISDKINKTLDYISSFIY